MPTKKYYTYIFGIYLHTFQQIPLTTTVTVYEEGEGGITAIQLLNYSLHVLPAHPLASFCYHTSLTRTCGYIPVHFFLF